MKTVSFEGRRDGPTNMALDIEMLERADQGTVGARVYDWEGPWVSLGRSQSAVRALLPECPVPFVMRPTGGKAVLHGHDVTVGLALPLTTLGLPPEQSRSIAPVYRKVVGILVEALRGGGVRAELGENTLLVRTEGHTADCFAHVAPNDIVDPSTGQKVCGCALRVTQKAVLVQASIPCARPLVDPSVVFLRPSTTFWTPLDARAFADSLDSALGGTVLRIPFLT